MPYFIDFLKTANLFESWVKDCPLSYTSPNAPSKVNVLGKALEADPELDLPMVLEGEVAQMAEAAGKYVRGVDVESSDDWFFNTRPTLGRTSTAVFRFMQGRNWTINVILYEEGGATNLTDAANTGGSGLFSRFPFAIYVVRKSLCQS